MASQEEVFKKLVAHCKEYGFVFPSSEIYDGLGAVYDYGQNGVELKNNIKKYWWDSMVLLHENVVGIDAAIFMHPTTWKASGHVDAFNDPLIDNKDSKKRYRADVLIEDHLAKFDEKINKECEKAAKRFGESFDREMFCQTNPRVLENVAKRDAIHSRFVAALEASDLAELNNLQELNENMNLDEVSYLDYEIPSMETLDSNDMETLYHVTQKHTVESICKFGFDREFNCKNGNCYGEGVYTTLNVNYARELIGSHYGTSILQTKLIGGFDRFIIFDNWQLIVSD